MTTIYDFALKIEASWAKKDVKSSSETGYVLCMFGIFILK